MSTQSVTLQLPDAVMRRARQAAELLQHPLEEVLADVLAAALPDVEDAPADMQFELTQMTWLSDGELWNIARSMMGDESQSQLQALSEAQEQRPLSGVEERQLELLRQEYGRTTLRKARAYALLSLRSGRSLLADN